MNLKFNLKTILLGALFVTSAQASAITYDLCADEISQQMSDGTAVTMWGYGLDTGTACDVTVPGPSLSVPVGDNSLIINLRNYLSDNVSIVISGQQTILTPVTFIDGKGRTRVRSFTHETASGSTGVYTWNNIKPGTYLYSSGTHPAVQVQMGLYGSMTHNFATRQAYPGKSYDNEVILVYSEIDPEMHNAVALGNYGTIAYPSTINYKPKYFLVNGESFQPGDLPLVAGSVGDTTLIRLLNAGLENHALVLQGIHLSIVAEDGNLYPYAREQYSILMAAGKTRDALFVPNKTGIYPLYDRRLRVGMLTNLEVMAASSGPNAVNDSVTVVEDSGVSTINVLSNDTQNGNPIDPTTVSIESPASGGVVAANNSGVVSYTPNPNFSGSDSFTYSVRDTAGTLSNIATVNITVSPTNDAPLAAADSFEVPQDSNDTIFDVLINDTDLDGDTLFVNSVGSTSNAGTLVNNSSHLTYSPASGYVGLETFDYTVSDGQGGISNSATVTVNVTAVVNQAPVANDDIARVIRNTRANPGNSVTINLIANDSDPDGTIDSSSVNITANPRKGNLVNHGDGTVTYTPKRGRRGSDTFAYTVVDNLGLISNEATVRVNLVNNVAPVANNDSAAVQRNTNASPNNTVTINIIANDTDSDGTIDPASITITRNTTKGTIVINSDGTVTYKPNKWKRRLDYFKYKVRDDLGVNSNAARVNINIRN